VRREKAALFQWVRIPPGEMLQACDLRAAVGHIGFLITMQTLIIFWNIFQKISQHELLAIAWEPILPVRMQFHRMENVRQCAESLPIW